MLVSCHGVPATPENARSVVGRLCTILGPPRFSADMLQTVMARRYNYTTRQYDRWDFVNTYEAGLRDEPVFDPANGRFVLEYVKGQWRIVTPEDFDYYFGVSK